MEIDKLKIKKIIIISILSLIAIWWIYTRYIVTDEAKIRKTIRTVKGAIQELDTNTIMKYISRDYHDKEGHTRSEIFQVLFRYERVYKKVDIFIFSTDIQIYNEVGEKVALIEVIASVNGVSKAEEKLPLFREPSEKYKFIFKFLKEGNTWKILEFIDYNPVDASI